MRPRVPAPYNADRRRLSVADRLRAERWARQLLDDPAAHLADLSEDMLSLVAEGVLRLRGEQDRVSEVDRALTATQPQRLQPETDAQDVVEDLRAVLAVPEVAAFWREWTARRGRRGPKGADSYGRAVMFLMALPGRTSDAKGAVADLHRSEGLQRVFAEAEARAGRPFALLTYATANRRRKKLSHAGLSMDAQRACCHMVRNLREIYGVKDAGRWLLVDVTSVP